MCTTTVTYIFIKKNVEKRFFYFIYFYFNVIERLKKFKKKGFLRIDTGTFRTFKSV